MTKAKKTAKKQRTVRSKTRTVDAFETHKLWIEQQVMQMQSNCSALIEGVRAHLRTMEHKLSLDESSRADMRQLRDALTECRKELEYRRSFGR